jgi:PleD family two-component response regulator
MKKLHRLFRSKKDSTLEISSEKIFHQKLKIERSRTHRNGHEFSVVIFDLEELQLSKKNIETMIETIKSRIRDIDHLGWYDKNRVGVILPYTSAKGAKEFSNNIIKCIDDAKKESKYNLITYPPEKKASGEKKDKSALRSL